MSSKRTRTRTWMFIVYPDSAPNDWEDVLNEELGYSCWCHSPLHDKDFNANGEIKKPHWHVLLVFDGVKSYEQIEDIAKSVNGTAPKACQQSSSMIRYFTHIDNPEKAQYDRKDIKAFGGLDVESPYTKSTDFEEMTFQSIYQIIKENKFYNIIDLEDYLNDNALSDYKIFVHTHTLLVSKYLDGVYQKMAPIIKAKQDKEELRYRKQLHTEAEKPASVDNDDVSW